MKNFIRLLLAIFIILIFGLIFYIGSKDLTGNETLLLTILLTIVSVLASVIASHYYSLGTIKQAVDQVNQDNQSKLKTYALKAAEKVDSLSRELKKLSLYLQDELEQEYENPNEESISREEKIKSTIYIAETLKSINDNALSDWRGVIGEELEEREELEREKAEEVSNIVERFEDIVSTIKKDAETRYVEENTENTHKEIEYLRKDINLLIKNLDNVKIPKTVKRKKELKQEVTNPCPSCGSQLSYKQRPMINSVKSFKCKSCSTEIIGRWQAEKGFYLDVPIILNENITCPTCGFLNTIELSSRPQSILFSKCTKCNESYRVIRGASDIKISLTKNSLPLKEPSEITEDLIGQIKKELPPQPWPSGTHREVAIKLGISPAIVYKIMNVLIDRGEAFVQYNGKLYTEKEL